MSRMWLAVAMMGCAPSAAQLDEIRALFATKEASLVKADKGFAAAVGKRPPPGEGAPCKVAFHTADAGQFAERLVGFIALAGSDGPLQASNVTYFTARAQLDSLSSGSVAARRTEQQRLLNRESWYADLDGKKLVAQARKLVAEPLEAELLIEIGGAINAAPIDKKTFQAGVMVGRTWLYSPSEDRFVCAGNVVATSSQSVEVWRWKDSPSSDGKFEIAADLYMRMESEAEKSLKTL